MVLSNRRWSYRRRHESDRRTNSKGKKPLNENADVSAIRRERKGGKNEEKDSFIGNLHNGRITYVHFLYAGFRFLYPAMADCFGNRQWSVASFVCHSK